jgi:hypothetical protein
MRLHRRTTRWLASLLVSTLLFMQVAAAAYVCPMGGGAAAPAEAMEMMPGCDGHLGGADMDTAQLPLCKAHCEQGQQSTASGPDLSPGSAPLLLAVLDWGVPALRAPAASACAQAIASGAPPPGSPPLYLSLLVLRN